MAPITPTWDDVSSDSLTKLMDKHWSPYKISTFHEFDINIVEHIYKHELFNKHKFLLKKIMLLEFSQYLENYLWPNFTNETDSIAFIMSIVLMVNEKIRQRVSALKIFSTNEEIFPIFFDKLLHLLLEDKLSHLEQTQCIIFLNQAFNSLEIDFIRKSVQKLVSLITWASINENRREAEFSKFAKLKKLYNALMKKENKLLGPGESPSLLYRKSVFDRTFMHRLLQNFVCNVLGALNQSSATTPRNSRSTLTSYNHLVQYIERFLELLIDLEAHLPNRRFFKVLLDASHVIPHCTLSLKEMRMGIGDNKEIKEKLKLFGQLLVILKFYHDFEINDITGEALTEDEMTDLHYDQITHLQKICFKNFKSHPTLLKFALANVCKVDTRPAMLPFFAALNAETLKSLCVDLNLIDDSEKSNELSKEFLLELIIFKHERRDSQLQAINDMPLFPTEKVLWDQNLVPDDYYTGEDCLALPKLNLQFLTLHDYLLRNFRLFQLETTYEIRQDVQDSLFRLKPWISENPQLNKVIFGGWARMAAPIHSFNVIDIGKPEIGGQATRMRPSKVRADVTVNLNVRDDVMEEWQSIRKYDVCFLIALEPNKPYGYKYKFKDFIPKSFNKPKPQAKKKDENEDEETENDEDLPRVEPFPLEFGVKYVRGCEVEGMLDADGKVIEESGPTQREKISLPKGPTRTWRVYLDANQYSIDFQNLADLSSDDSILENPARISSSEISYDETCFHVLMRRKPKENNFKAVLATIRRIMNIAQGRPASLEGENTAKDGLLVNKNEESNANQFPGKEEKENGKDGAISGGKGHNEVKIAGSYSTNTCEEAVLPQWLNDTILGFGEPDSARYPKVVNIFKKKYPNLIGLDEDGYLDMRDTFLTRQHLISCFPDNIVEFDNNIEDISADATTGMHNIFYKLKFPGIDNSSSPIEDSLTPKVIRVKEYMIEGFGPPTSNLKIPRNELPFTPTQVEAIKSGLLPGLTMVVGPPGTGKTDLAVQIARLAYNRCSNYTGHLQERILIITHSNQALNQIFLKISQFNTDPCHLLRLGHGGTVLDADYGKYGRVDCVLKERMRMLKQVAQLRDSLLEVKAESIFHGNYGNISNVANDLGMENNINEVEMDETAEDDFVNDSMIKGNNDELEIDKTTENNVVKDLGIGGDNIEVEMDTTAENEATNNGNISNVAKDLETESNVADAKIVETAENEGEAMDNDPQEVVTVIEEPGPTDLPKLEEEGLAESVEISVPVSNHNLTRDNIVLESYRHFKLPPFSDAIRSQHRGSYEINYYKSPDLKFTCETAMYFYRYEISSRWDAFRKGMLQYKQSLSDQPSNGDDKVDDLNRPLVEKLMAEFPFTTFVAQTMEEIKNDPKAHNFVLGDDSCQDNELFLTSGTFEENMKIAESYFKHIKRIFDRLEEFRAFEILRNGPERVNYLLIRSARIIAMTCTHAALRRADLVKAGFKYDTLIIEEAGQILEIEGFIPLLLQNTKDNVNRLKRCIMIGDHNQLPPVIKNLAFKNFANMEQSMFARLIRLGVPAYTLDAQGRAKPSLCDLYSWRYTKLGNLPHTYKDPLYLKANPGFAFDYQFIDVQDFNGVGESQPTPHYFQNLAEAEYSVSIFTYMRLLGYPAESISILTTYNGQKYLIRDIVEKRCAQNPLLGIPNKITTVDKYQGQQNDYVILSLVRTKSIGHFRDVRRLIVAVSRARLGLYILGRVSLFSRCLELTPVFKRVLYMI
ncbi:RNA helicase aquarius-like [Gordionus sp. m RMFG-2023]|uniref:RNA helicase aquarius-like n=1 Tax=Gordionus sp. m RMFG-2023 TaxID=3053472 RepID=UPI0031FD5B72